MAIIGLQKRSGKIVESQGKVSEKSGNFDMDNEWQPCEKLLTGTLNKKPTNQQHLSIAIPCPPAGLGAMFTND